MKASNKRAKNREYAAAKRAKDAEFQLKSVSERCDISRRKEIANKMEESAVDEELLKQKISLKRTRTSSDANFLKLKRNALFESEWIPPASPEAEELPSASPEAEELPPFPGMIQLGPRLWRYRNESDLPHGATIPINRDTGITRSLANTGTIETN